MTHPQLVEAMSRTDFYPHHPAVVELINTHISHVFIAGDFVYKVKKTVVFDFLDFSTLKKRKFYCEEELRLNRRLAADFYLDVVPIHEDAHGKPTLSEGVKIIEYAVLMKKLPQDKMLITMLARGLAGKEVFAALGKKIAEFHAQALSNEEINKMGSPETISINHEENFSEMLPYVDITIPAYQYELIKHYDELFISRKKSLLEKRMSEKRIRECHGDLHLEHICLTADIAVYDCIEFNKRFRCVDTAAEVAFLAMDMDFNGYQEQGDIFIKSYIHYSGDADIKLLLNFYRCYYAFVRGKVASLRLAQREEAVASRLDIMEKSEKYFDLAYTYAARVEKPVLIITAGLMGSGKSYLAKEIGLRLGAAIIRLDALRKEMSGIKPVDRRLESFGQGIYDDATSRAAYDKACAMAARLLENSRPAIIDASFRKRSERQAAAALAQKLGVNFYVIECVCAEEISKDRLERRIQENKDVSDGRWEIFARQKQDFDAIDEIKPSFHIKVDTSMNHEKTVQEIIKKIKDENFG